MRLRAAVATPGRLNGSCIVRAVQCCRVQMCLPGCEAGSVCFPSCGRTNQRVNSDMCHALPWRARGQLARKPHALQPASYSGIHSLLTQLHWHANEQLSLSRKHTTQVSRLSSHITLLLDSRPGSCLSLHTITCGQSNTRTHKHLQQAALLIASEASQCMHFQQQQTALADLPPT